MQALPSSTAAPAPAQDMPFLINSLPLEVQVNIIGRLSDLSLLTSRRVSRLWKQMLDEPIFWEKRLYPPVFSTDDSNPPPHARFFTPRDWGNNRWDTRRNDLQMRFVDLSEDLFANYVSARYESGMRILEAPTSRGRRLTAIALIQEASDQLYPPAMRYLAECYETGQNQLVQRDLSRAIALYNEAAGEGDAKALYKLGSYYNEIGGKQHQAEAVRLYQRAIDMGDSAALYSLSLCYAHGSGVEKNPEEAGRLIRLSADRGNADGLLTLGKCYRDGAGVEQNEQEAIRLFRLACKIEPAIREMFKNFCWAV